MEDKKKYGLFTSITMIMGIVIGSGIFFKADDVLIKTNGNLLLGILVFIVAAISIIFGCLAISQLATRTDKPGGIISYAEEFVNKETASSFGWFQTFLYMPALIAIVGYVASIYIFQLFGYEASLLTKIGLSFCIVTFIFGVNILSAKLGGYFQNISMIIKLIPLILIVIFGFIKGNPVQVISSDISNIKEGVMWTGVLSAFGPIAFSFDGWVVSTSICNEIKNSKRNLPLALIISPILVLICYVLYFIGISVLVGPNEVLSLGDGTLSKAASIVFGSEGAKIIIIFVIISVLGTCNGLTLGFIRIPHSLAIRNMLPKSDVLSKQNKNGSLLNSAIFCYILAVIWIVINYFYILSGLEGDVGEIAICVSYLNYVVLYFVIIRFARQGEIKSKFKGYFVPIMAILGSFIILLGGIGNKLFILYILICLFIMAMGYFYTKSKNKK